MKKFFITLLCLLLIIGAGLFAYKKIGIDSNGYYANSRLTYTRDYGFSMLITYYPNNQRGDAKGFAVTNIPVAALFSERKLIQEYSKEKTDSKDILNLYQTLALLGDNNIIDYLARTFTESGRSTKSVDVGNKGKYFIISLKEMGL